MPDEQFDNGGSQSRTSGWFLTTENYLDSLDCRRHIDWLISKVIDRQAAIKDMVEEGFKIDIFVYWVSRQGHGGPILSPFQMRRLAQLGIDIGWDVYLDCSEDDEPKEGEQGGDGDAEEAV